MQPAERLIDDAVELGRAGRVRQAAHMLRERLVLDPHDAAVRDAIVAVYQNGGHPDQAARYAFAFGEYDAKKADPYLRWLAVTGADEARIRHLSVLPDDVVIPTSALDRIEKLRARPEAQEPWDTVATFGAVSFMSLALMTLIVVYVVVLLGGNFGRPVAAAGGAITAAALAVGAFGAAVSSWQVRARWAAAIAGTVSVLALTLCVFTALALLS